MAESVKYLGHLLIAEGHQSIKAKVLAVQNALIPQDITQLKSFLGLINHDRVSTRSFFIINSGTPEWAFT